MKLHSSHSLLFTSLHFTLLYYFSYITSKEQNTAIVPRKWWKYIISSVIQFNRIRKQQEQEEKERQEAIAFCLPQGEDIRMSPFQHYPHSDDEAFPLLQENDQMKLQKENDCLLTENRNLKHVVRVLRKISSSLIDPNVLAQFVSQQLQQQRGDDEYEHPIELNSVEDAVLYGLDASSSPSSAGMDHYYHYHH